MEVFFIIILFRKWLILFSFNFFKLNEVNAQVNSVLLAWYFKSTGKKRASVNSTQHSCNFIFNFFWQACSNLPNISNRVSQNHHHFNILCTVKCRPAINKLWVTLVSLYLANPCLFIYLTVSLMNDMKTKYFHSRDSDEQHLLTSIVLFLFFFIKIKIIGYTGWNFKFFFPLSPWSSQWFPPKLNSRPRTALQID